MVDYWFLIQSFLFKNESDRIGFDDTSSLIAKIIAILHFKKIDRMFGDHSEKREID